MQVFPDHIAARPAVRLISQHPSGVEGASRFEIALPKGKAIADGYLTKSEALLTVWQIHTHTSFYEDLIGAGRLVFVFHLSGTREIQLESCGTHELKPHRFSVYYHPKGIRRRGIWRTGRNQYSIGIGFWPSQLPDELIYAVRLIPKLSKVLDNDCEAFWIDSNFTYDMEHAVRQIINPCVHPSLIESYISIKVNELLCAGIDALLTTHTTSEAGPDVARHKAIQVKNTIDMHLDEQPKLRDLADELCVREKVLADEFRMLTGLSVGQYFVQQRMDRARLLLATTSMPLKQIAYELGYNHTSNFCIAFKRHYGCTPTEIRESVTE